ncbi:MAG: hypothetical protein E7236_06155 [Lachnospiraceae bacterium]|nr:hypothetical protein [Lachnospiraceae bacterium]
MKTIAKRITVLLMALAVSVTFVPTVGSTAAYAAEAVESQALTEDLNTDGQSNAAVETDLAADGQEETAAAASMNGSAQEEIESESSITADASSEAADVQSEDGSDNPSELSVAVSSVVPDTPVIKSIDNAVVSGVSNQICTGKEIKFSSITVKLDGETLTEDVDYEVSYLNNIGPGTAQLTVLGIGNYTGQKAVDFKITCAMPVFNTITNTGSGFQLKWTSVPGAVKYRIFKKTGNGTLVKLTDTTNTQYLDTAVESGVKYAYSVCCLDAKNNIVSEYDHTGTPASYTIALGPGRISQVTSGRLNFKITYQKIANAQGYEIRYSLNPDMSGSATKILDANTTSLDVTSAQEGIYFVQVRAFARDYTGKLLYGNWSDKTLAKFVRYDIGISETELQRYISGVKSNQSVMAMLYAFSRVGYPYSQIHRLTGDYYDCSSLVWYAWDSAGIQLTDDWVGTAAAEAKALTEANRTIAMDQLMPGSLIFFGSGYNGRYRNISHVAMYVGNGMVVEAAGTKTGVVFRQLSSSRLDSAVVCGDPINGGYWQKINGEWYYLRADEVVTNAWAKDSHGWCWLGSDGRIIKNQWLLIGGNWYHVNAEGYREENRWIKDSHGWRWLDANGRAVKNKWIKSGGSWYYLKADSYMAANAWAKDSIGWCWMNGNGNITRNKWIKVSGEWYYLKSNGYMAVNEWKKDSHGWCWMNGSGRIAKNKWVKYNGSWYYLKSNGYMAANTWVKDSRGWCWMEYSGKMAKSRWVKASGSWYYINSSGYMVTGTQRIGGKTYRFNSSGKWIS